MQLPNYKNNESFAGRTKSKYLCLLLQIHLPPLVHSLLTLQPNQYTAVVWLLQMFCSCPKMPSSPFISSYLFLRIFRNIINLINSSLKGKHKNCILLKGSIAMHIHLYQHFSHWILFVLYHSLQQTTTPQERNCILFIFVSPGSRTVSGILQSTN